VRRVVADILQAFLTQRLSVAEIGTPCHSRNILAFSLFVRQLIRLWIFFLLH
jgi:hypothetical protein